MQAGGQREMVTVIFPAAGAGRRMKAGMNKVFLELAGKPILVHTLMQFSRSPMVDDFVVVAAAEEVDFIQKLLCDIPGLKPFKVVAGSTERQYSIRNGLRAAPVVSLATIEGVIRGAQEVGGAIAAVPEKNTIKTVGKDGLVCSTLPRETLWEVQTPQGFRRDILFRANEQAEADGFLGTDDSSLVERLGVPVKVVESDYRNIKITTPEDLIIAEALLHEGS